MDPFDAGLPGVADGNEIYGEVSGNPQGEALSICMVAPVALLARADRRGIGDIGVERRFPNSHPRNSLV
jgi:hypothetical protein